MKSQNSDITMATIHHVGKTFNLWTINLCDANHRPFNLQQSTITQSDSIHQTISFHWLSKRLTLVVRIHPNPSFHFFHVIVTKDQRHGSRLPLQPLQVTTTHVVKGVNILGDVSREWGSTCQYAMPNRVDLPAPSFTNSNRWWYVKWGSSG